MREGFGECQILNTLFLSVAMAPFLFYQMINRNFKKGKGFTGCGSLTEEHLRDNVANDSAENQRERIAQQDRQSKKQGVGRHMTFIDHN